jgi:hypothetical protein
MWSPNPFMLRIPNLLQENLSDRVGIYIYILARLFKENGL